MELQRIWTTLGISAEFLRERSAWLKEQRSLHDRSMRFFDLAGALVWHSQFEYAFASLAFFQAAIGVERALKLHYRDENGKLGELLTKAVEGQIVGDSTFGDIPSVSQFVLKSLGKEDRERCVTHSEKLAAIVPQLRNEFFHGTYLLAPEYLHLTVQLREIADALAAKQGGANRATWPGA